MRKIRIRKRRILLGIIALLFVVSVGASFYFFHVAQIREENHSLIIMVVQKTILSTPMSRVLTN